MSSVETAAISLSLSTSSVYSNQHGYIQFEITPIAVLVEGRWIFYNNSAFDNEANGSSNSDAIATDKAPLLPGETATLNNYTSYSRGINGIMVDIANLANPAGLDSNDFSFKVGNTDDTSVWTAAPASTVSVDLGAGVNDSDRVTLIWPDNAIQGQWLQVTVLDTANTGLQTSDIFYFGNAIGETGDSAENAAVNGLDEARVRANFRTSSNPVDITNLFDFNRDRFVNAFDQVKIRAFGTTSSTMLKLITPTLGAEVSSTALAQSGLAGNLIPTGSLDGGVEPTQSVEDKAQIENDSDAQHQGNASLRLRRAENGKLVLLVQGPAKDQMAVADEVEFPVAVAHGAEGPWQVLNQQSHSVWRKAPQGWWIQPQIRDPKER